MKKQIKNLSCKRCLRNKQARLWTELCQACYKKKMRYSSSKFKLCTIYQAIKNRCTNKRDGYYYGMEFCSKDEFISKFENDKCFLKLFNNWKISGKNMKLAPSIDRIDNKKGYLIDNIEFIEHSKNCWKDSKTTPVMVIKDEQLVGIYLSLNLAVTELKVQQSNAWKVLHGEREHTQGYIFEGLEYE